MLTAQLRSRCAHRAGSTLLLALWALFLLSAVVLGWAKYIDRGIETAGVANLTLEAKALAHSGVALALHPQTTKRSPYLRSQSGRGRSRDRSYEVKIKSEGSKLNLNYLITGEDQNRLDFLKSALETEGLSKQERDTFVDCLLDWVDEDTNRHLNGVEEDGTYRAPNRGRLLSLDEIPKIRGSKPLVSRPNWKDGFTLMSSGPLDVEDAPVDLIACVPGIGTIRAMRFGDVRKGKDRKEGTDDDFEFKDLNEAISYLGLTPMQFTKLNGVISFRDPIVKIHSVGRAVNVKWQVEVIARKVPGGNSEIVQWNESESK